MAYCTQADILTRIGSEELVALADLDEDGTADATTIAEAIADADGHINSYLEVKYTVPVSPVPDVLVKRSTILAIYFLQLHRNSLTEDYKQAFKDITAWLKDVVAGKASLGVSTPKPAEGAGAATVDYTVKDRVFGRDEPL
ncbi:MAG TPA: DUF1320 domain-containing protein [Phycisphaerae bacterium]|nr:DUF1320 domain-containing protein [Phycisphaerae bacterium]